MLRPLLLVPMIAVGACQTPASRGEPSLAPRAAEAIDPRLPVDSPLDVRPTTTALASRLAALLGEARTAQAAVAAAEPAARGRAAAAGAPQSESWIAAQLALSQLERAGAPITRVAGELDDLRSATIRSGNASAADLAALEAASAEMLAMTEAYAATLAAIRVSIAG